MIVVSETRSCPNERVDLPSVVERLDAFGRLVLSAAMDRPVQRRNGGGCTDESVKGRMGSSCACGGVGVGVRGSLVARDAGETGCGWVVRFASWAPGRGRSSPR
jgi:hypothetical protein